MALNEFEQAWVQFSLAFQELTDSIRMLLPEVTRVEYWQCTQDPNHIWDYDAPNLIYGGDHWRVHGKMLCPKCGAILEQRTAKVGKR